MPFTLSHVAAVLPLRRLNLVWSAAVIGSMAPDFPYILGTTKYRALGHFYPGILYFTFPAALAALWLFHAALKKPFVELLPAGFQQRLQEQLGDFEFGGLNRWAAIVISVVLGIATHLIWDAFTHAYSWPWMRWAWLQSWVNLPIAGRMPMFMALQYGSSLFGIVVVGVWVLLWYRNTSPESHLVKPESRVDFGITVFVLAGLIGVARALIRIHGLPGTLKGWDSFMVRSFVTALAITFWTLLIYCLSVSVRRRWKSR